MAFTKGGSVSDSLRHSSAVPRGGWASRTGSPIHVCLPSWLGLLRWKCPLGMEVTSWAAALRRSAPVCIGTQRKHLHFQAARHPVAKLFWKSSPWVRYIRKSQMLLKHQSREAGQTLLNGCPGWPCWVLGQGELAQRRHPGRPPLRCGLCGRQKSNQEFCCGRQTPQPEGDRLSYFFLLLHNIILRFHLLYVQSPIYSVIW